MRIITFPFTFALGMEDANWPKIELWLNKLIFKFLLAEIIYLLLSYFNLTFLLPQLKIYLLLGIGCLMVFLISLSLIYLYIINLFYVIRYPTKGNKISIFNSYPDFIQIQILKILKNQKASYPSPLREVNTHPTLLVGDGNIKNLKKNYYINLLKYFTIFILNLFFITLTFFNLNIFNFNFF